MQLFSVKNFVIKFILRTIYSKKGLLLGEKTLFSGLPNLLIEQNSSIHIGDLCIIRNMIEIRSLKSSSVSLGRNCRIDNFVRLLSTNQSKLSIGNNSRIGFGTIMNGGSDLTIGENVLVSGYVYIQTSNHLMARSNRIINQGFDHKPIIIEDDVWIGAHSIILPGVKLGKGCVIGANSVVTRDTEEYSLNVGSPTKLISYRK